MTIVPHTLTGAAVGTLTDNIYLAFLFGIVSHFILDMMPHLEPSSLVEELPDGTKKWSAWIYIFVIIEFGLAIAFFAAMRQRPDFPVLLSGAVGGIFPDLIVNNPFLAKLRFKPIFKQIFWFHDKIHIDLDAKFWPISLIVESLLIGGTLWYLLKF